MPVLIVNNSHGPQGLLLEDRVLIGRRPFNTVMVAEPSVSRIHAWIGQRNGHYVLFDAGSRSGTLLNGQPLAEPRILADNDEIRVGPAILTYLEAEELPEDVAPLEIPEPPPASDPYDGGIYFDCACGGPMWVGAELAGKSGRCRYCGERLVVPHVSGQIARPIRPAAQPEAAVIATQRAKVAAARRPPPVAPPAPETRNALCSICQSPILTSEEHTSCPSCHLTFHTQCWEENYGCSAYGCDQVNVLAPPGQEQGSQPQPEQYTMAEGESAAPVEYEAPPIPAHHFPWEPVLLALSFVMMAIGALTYGIPSAVMLIAIVACWLMGKGRRRGLMIVALVVAIIGIAAGYVTSMFWWKGTRVWEAFLK